MKTSTICLLIWDIGVPLIWLHSWIRGRQERKKQRLDPAGPWPNVFDAEWILNLKVQ